MISGEIVTLLASFQVKLYWLPVFVREPVYVTPLTFTLKAWVPSVTGYNVLVDLAGTGAPVQPPGTYTPEYSKSIIKTGLIMLS